MMPSWQELLPILIILIVIFGARKLPEIGAGLGKGIKEFKKSMRDIDKEDEEKTETSKPIEAKVEEVKDVESEKKEETKENQ